MTLGSTQRLTEMSTRNISWGVKEAGARADNLTTFMCWLSWNLGASTSWNPKGLSWPVQGQLYLLALHLRTLHISWQILIKIGRPVGGLYGEPLNSREFHENRGGEKHTSAAKDVLSYFVHFSSDLGRINYRRCVRKFMGWLWGVTIGAVKAILFFLWRRAPQQTLRTHRSLKTYCATLWWRWRERWLFFFHFSK
jgi:hypothetical protein